MSSDLSVAFPRALTSYADPPGASLLGTLASRIHAEPFNAIATAIFLLAVLHTFFATRFTRLARRRQQERAENALTGRHPADHVGAELLHFLGEIEVVFGMWAVVLALALTAYAGWDAARSYLNDTVNYTEPLFVVVIMALAATRPIVTCAEAGLRRLAAAGGGTPAAWWASILIVGPLIGSFITEPAAMTICALLLARQFFDRRPSLRLKYATLGLLFVNVSIGGTLTPFAAPPVLMVARPWGWDTTFMLAHVGWRAAVAITVSTIVYAVYFRRELRALSAKSSSAAAEAAGDAEAATPLPIPAWVTAVHLTFMIWTVVNAEYPALFIGGFLFFLGFARATAAHQNRLDLRTPLLVGFFLAGLVVHGGLQGWWMAPLLRRLSRTPLFLGATMLTAFNDNALITYLATLVPTLDARLKLAIVQGAVTGGGLTVIANAPNPAGQALLSRFFGGAVSPLGLLLGALIPTAITALLFSL